MTYTFGGISKNKLTGVHPDLVGVAECALSFGILDFSVSEGVRTEQRQKELLQTGFTKTLASKHLIQADGYGHALDLYPYPIDMARVQKGDAREIARFGLLAGLMLRAAQDLGVKIRWGADWDGDGQTLDHSFFDAPHFELVKGT